jgi:hypothetical protein
MASDYLMIMSLHLKMTNGLFAVFSLQDAEPYNANSKLPAEAAIHNCSRREERVQKWVGNLSYYLLLRFHSSYYTCTSASELGFNRDWGWCMSTSYGILHLTWITLHNDRTHPGRDRMQFCSCMSSAF